MPDLPNLIELTAAALRDNPGYLDELIDAREVSRVSGVSIATLETMRCRGGGPLFTKPVPGRCLYSRRAVFEWLKAREHRSTSDTADPKAAA